MPSLRNLENQLEIKLIGRLCCLQTTIHFKEKNFGPTPDGGEILVKVQISVAIMQIERTGSTNSDFDQ